MSADPARTSSAAAATVAVAWRALRDPLRATVRNEPELRGFVARITLLCVVVALAVDVLNQLAFFTTWALTLKSWFVTTVLALAIALPVSLSVGRAHLELYRAKLAVEELSRTDPLTGVLNRRALFDLSETVRVMALVIVDIDRFKRVNDGYGHLVGDDVIRAVAEAMRAELDAFGHVGRLGGEEFALLSTATADDAFVSRLWQFRDRVAAVPIIAGSGGVRATVSVGLAVRQDGQTFADLYGAADRALYLAKAGGRNRVVIDPGPEALGPFAAPASNDASPGERSGGARAA